MHTAAESSLALTFLSSFDAMAGVLPTAAKLELNRQISQALIRGMYQRQSLHVLAERLIAVADHAYPLRQMEVVEQASNLLMGLPLPREFKSIACYYKAICLKQRGQIDEARALFEQVAEKATSRYKARAMLGLGTLVSSCGDFQSGMSLFIEGGRAIMRAREFDPLAAFYTQSGLAILKSIDGDHRSALADWEGLFPLVRAISTSYPSLYYNHLNSLAVELLEAGRITEARNVSNIVLASPYASAYPEYRETGRDIALRGRRASRSVVSFVQPQLNAPNVLRLPSAEHINSNPSVELASDLQKPARVFDMQKWKKKMGKEPNGDPKDRKPGKDMSQDEMLYEIMNTFTEPDMDWNIRMEMLETIRKLAAKQRAKKQDKNPDKDSDQD
jgi:tetratricopeptide (TPR) repeat protein